ncbi:MAG: M28 family peptidase [Bacteroidota bacterium]
MRKILLSVGMLWMACTMAWAQQAMPATEFMQTISADDFKAHLYFLADDLLEGRETGERGQHLAAIYIRAQFMRLGLKPGNIQDDTYFQKYYLNRTKIKDVKMTIDGVEMTYPKDFVTASGGVVEKLDGEMVFAGYGIETADYNNLEGLEIEGKIAVAMLGRPDNMEKPTSRFAFVETLRKRKQALQEKGAKAVVMVVPDSTYKVIRRYARRSSISISGEKIQGPTGIYISQTAASQFLPSKKMDMAGIQAALNTSAEVPNLKLKKKKFALESDVEMTSKEASNVLSVLEGTDLKDEYVVITGHYDHVGTDKDGVVYNGADDDGSGTTAVLEIAEAFVKAAEAGNRPRRSIIFMTVSGEEKGLLGSEFYTDNPIYPLAQTVTNLNIDMIGRIDNRYADKEDARNYVYVIGSDKLSSDLHAIHEEANKQYTNLTLDYKYNDENDPNRFYYRSDHYNFAKNKIPIIFYFNGTHVDYHKPGDDPYKIEFEKAAKIAQLAFVTAWEVANRDERPVVDKEDNR